MKERKRYRRFAVNEDRTRFPEAFTRRLASRDIIRFIVSVERVSKISLKNSRLTFSQNTAENAVVSTESTGGAVIEKHLLDSMAISLKLVFKLLTLRIVYFNFDNLLLLSHKEFH